MIYQGKSGNTDFSFFSIIRRNRRNTSTIIEKFEELKQVLPKNNQPSFIRRLDNCIFCHGGLASYFVYDIIENYKLPDSAYDDIDTLIDIINRMDAGELWMDGSPLWYRPQYYKGHMYKEDAPNFLQVVGHTTVQKIYEERNVLSCDVFSKEHDGITPIGTEEFVILDTVSLEWKGIQ